MKPENQLLCKKISLQISNEVCFLVTFQIGGQFAFQRYKRFLVMNSKVFRFSFLFLFFVSVMVLNAQEPSIPIIPRHYVCYHTTGSLVIDGKLTEKDWEKAAWTEDFVDIEGSLKPLPQLKTHAKMLWDDNYLYVLAFTEEPHVWGTLTERESVIFYDPDFEIFIDPDGDTHNYAEFEMNALNTQWDLLLTKPYRDDTLSNVAIDNWNYNGMKSAVHVMGTINNPCDVDTGWCVEVALPLDALAELSLKGKKPVNGQQYRLGFSRVEWTVDIVGGRYVKRTRLVDGKQRPLPENNWIWSPQGVINMHQPETWGFLQFSDKKVGEGSDEYIPDPDNDLKWALRILYYRERLFYSKNKIYTTDLKALGMENYKVNGRPFTPSIMTTLSAYEATIAATNDATWHILQDGKIWKSNR
jgi:hypothetical protein